MLKRFLLSLSLSLVFLVGCEQVEQLTQPSPEQVLEEYLLALKALDYAAAYQKLSSVDQTFQNLEEFQKEKSDDSPIAQLLVGKVSYEIEPITPIGDSATANVKTTMPDMRSMFTDLMSAAFTSALSDSQDTNAKMAEVFQEKYGNGDVPMTTTTVQHNLVKEQDGWRVFVDLKGKAEAVERKQRISELLASAEELQQQKEFQGAVEAYSDVLEADGDNEEALAGIEQVRTQIDEEREKQDYLPNIRLYDFEARRIDTYSKKEVPAVRFALKNEGDRSLDRVEVTVYFKDRTGAIIFEEDYLPVLVSQYSFGDNKPLKSNYVWRQEQGKYYTVEELGPEWVTGSAEAIVSDIEFSP